MPIIHVLVCTVHDSEFCLISEYHVMYFIVEFCGLWAFVGVAWSTKSVVYSSQEVKPRVWAGFWVMLSYLLSKIISLIVPIAQIFSATKNNRLLLYVLCSVSLRRIVRIGKFYKKVCRERSFLLCMLRFCHRHLPGTILNLKLHEITCFGRASGYASAQLWKNQKQKYIKIQSKTTIFVTRLWLFTTKEKPSLVDKNVQTD